MNQTIQRGLLAVRADAGTLDVKATVDALNKAFADFKAEHTRQLDDIRKGLPGADQAAKVDKISAHVEQLQKEVEDAHTKLASAQMQGGPPGPGMQNILQLSLPT